MPMPLPYFEENDPSLKPSDRGDWIVVLPLGAHEQHGPHLPFETDTLIAEGIVKRTISAMPRSLPVAFLPVEPVGYSIEHMGVAGTKTLGFDEAVHRWLGIAEKLHDQGVNKFMMLNAHGGNSPLMTIVATEARVRFDMLAVATSWTRFGLPENLISAEDKAIDIHGGDIETSVMMAFHPEKVDMSEAKNFSSRQSEYEKRFRHLRAYGKHAFGWKMSDLNKTGVSGNAAAANDQKGEALIAHAVKGIVELLHDMAKFDVAELRQAPASR